VGRIEGDRVVSWTTASGLPSDRVRALHEDERGSLWIGTYDGGLVRLRDGKFAAIRARDGLHDDGVFAIVDDGMGRFWMSSNRGLHVAERAELDAFADGKAASVASWSFGRADGMLSTECNGGMQPSGIRRRDGTLVFPTQKGLAVVDPRSFRPSPIAPNVVIEEIASEHRAHAVAPEVTLEPNESRLEVRFTATTFVRPAQARFRYRLEGLDDEWAEAGTARFARYSYVPPGDYVFRVVASNGDGVWNETGASFALVVRPAWWQTAWLRAGLALALVGGIVAAFRVRIARLKRRRAEQDRFARQLIESQEAERKRIAGELHDGIGQTLAIIRNRALLGLRDGPISGRAQRQVEEIAEVATGAIDEIRKVTHNLRPYQLDRLGLARAIEALVEQAAAATGIEFDSAIDPLDGVFAPENEMNVYRIVQEAVGNLVRHAGATKARVEVRVRPTEVEIVVEDDGRGFDLEALPADKRGMGLSGIAERVRILGGRRTIRSTPGRGTRVSVRLPRAGARG
jgi:signal transduction histidine kinase